MTVSSTETAPCTDRPTEPEAAIEAGFCVLQVMDPSGDTRHIWDRTKEAEVSAIKTLWNELKKKGYMFYRVLGRDGDKGEQMRDFDPTAERMIAAPPMVGG